MPVALTEDDLYRLFLTKYGAPETTGWSPRQRLRFGYYQPSDHYEAIVEKFVTSGTRWVDVGGGRAIFPDNEKLSQELAQRCAKFVAVDPSANVHEHPYAHERHQLLFEEFETEDRFDLATLRMVAEHVVNPDVLLAKLAHLMTPGGTVIIYTINKLSPVPIITYLTPFSMHFRMKKLIWGGGEEKDTFPVAYKMNTRKKLLRQFSRHGFLETDFFYLDDLSVFSNFKLLNYGELVLWKCLNSVGITYPENNLLGIYRSTRGG